MAKTVNEIVLVALYYTYPKDALLEVSNRPAEQCFRIIIVDDAGY
jgi:hypothetical protein